MGLTGCRSVPTIKFPGQVAQSVERSPEKAGVGGSIPSLATMFSTTYSHLRQFVPLVFQNLIQGSSKLAFEWINSCPHLEQ